MHKIGNHLNKFDFRGILQVNAELAENGYPKVHVEIVIFEQNEFRCASNRTHMNPSTLS
jgi:hypothetical protein